MSVCSFLFSIKLDRFDEMLTKKQRNLIFLSNIWNLLHHNIRNFRIFAPRKKTILMEKETYKDINRIKVMLVEKKRTARWLSEQLGKDPATVSKWCTNTCQPNLETLVQIARLLEVDLNELVRV